MAKSNTSARSSKSNANNAAAAPAAKKSFEAIPAQQGGRLPRFQSQNSFELTGYIAERGFRPFEKGGCALTLVHPMGSFDKATGEVKGLDSLFLDCILFATNGTSAVEIPEGLVKPGSAVLVKGYTRSGNWTDKDGKKHFAVKNIILSIEPQPKNEEGKPVSVNRFAVTGTICGEKIFVSDEEKVARFTVRHPFAKRSNLDPLFSDIVMFSKNGKDKEVVIPTSLIAPKQRVLVSGYMRNGNWEDEKGGKHYRIDRVALSLTEQPLKEENDNNEAEED